MIVEQQTVLIYGQILPFPQAERCRFLWFVLAGAPAARVRGMRQPPPAGGTERADPCGPAGNASRGPDRSRANRHADGHDGVALAMNVPISAESIRRRFRDLRRAILLSG